MNSPIYDGVKELAEICVHQKITIGLTESCTGGLLSAWVAEVPGVSSFFKGGVVSYSGQVKHDILNVPLTTLRHWGEVSEPVALAMAQGGKEVLSCDWAVAITGIAGPGGGSQEKPVGTVCFAVIGPEFEKTVTKHFPSHLERHEIQRRSAVFAFDLLLSGLR